MTAKFIGIILLTMPFFVVASFASSTLDVLRELQLDPCRDPMSFLQLPENASPKEIKVACKKYMILKAIQKAEKRKGN